MVLAPLDSLLLDLGKIQGCPRRSRDLLTYWLDLNMCEICKRALIWMAQRLARLHLRLVLIRVVKPSGN